MRHVAYGWGIGNPEQQNGGYAVVPNTFEECVFNLLEPLAKAGRQFGLKKLINPPSLSHRFTIIFKLGHT